MEMVWNVLLAGVLCLLSHEGGHFLCALIFGHVLKFRFEWGRFGKIPVPRGIWNMPTIDRWKQRCVAAAGFGLELALAIPLFIWADDFGQMYLATAVLHFALYKFYAGDASDFQWF